MNGTGVTMDERSEIQCHGEPACCLNARQAEQLFCLALLDEGTDVVQRVTSRFIEYRDNPSPQVAVMTLAAGDNKQLITGGDG